MAAVEFGWVDDLVRAPFRHGRIVRTRTRWTPSGGQRVSGRASVCVGHVGDEAVVAWSLHRYGRNHVSGVFKLDDILDLAAGEDRVVLKVATGRAALASRLEIHGRGAAIVAHEIASVRGDR